MELQDMSFMELQDINSFMELQDMTVLRSYKT